VGSLSNLFFCVKCFGWSLTIKHFTVCRVFGCCWGKRFLTYQVLPENKKEWMSFCKRCGWCRIEPYRGRKR